MLKSHTKEEIEKIWIPKYEEEDFPVPLNSLIPLDEECRLLECKM